jgi:L-alanine-DL-glutamate epimerase-like enolase superfamily enzyme
VGEEIEIRIDANQGWTPEQAVKVLDKIEEFDIQFAEQPVSAEDLEGLRYVRETSNIPVMADESVHSPEDVLRLVEAKAVDLVNIKLMKSGGILKGRKIAAVAEAAGIPCMIGCMGESGLGIAAGAHLAAAVKNVQYTDLDSDLLLRDKLVQKGGVTIEDSKRTFPNRDGLGIGAMNRKLLGKPKRIYN